MKPFQLTVKAKSDLKDIALFTARRWGKEQRNVYLKQFDEAFWLLAENPDIGKPCDEIKLYPNNLKMQNFSKREKAFRQGINFANGYSLGEINDAE